MGIEDELLALCKVASREDSKVDEILELFKGLIIKGGSENFSDYNNRTIVHFLATLRLVLTPNNLHPAPPHERQQTL